LAEAAVPTLPDEEDVDHRFAARLGPGDPLLTRGGGRTEEHLHIGIAEGRRQVSDIAHRVTST
jgi:hypothetical protein